MKVLGSLSNFIWLFILIGVVVIKVFIFPSEPTPAEEFSFGKFTYAVGEYVIAIVSILVLGYLSLKVYEWLENKKQAKQSK